MTDRVPLKPCVIPQLGEDVMPVGAFCAPQPQKECGGVLYPSKITRSQYRLLAESGVNLVYGHNDVMGTDTEKEAWRALDYCAENGIAYLVRDRIFEAFASLGNRGIADYRRLSASEKQKLAGELKKCLRRYSAHPAFAGVAFFDEPGSDSFPGIADAKKVFEKVCPDKLFYVNMLPYYVTPAQYQYGYTGGMEATDSAYLKSYPRNVCKYEVFLNRFLDIVKPQVFSYDAYPFVNFGSCESTVHEVLYEMQQLGADTERRLGIPFWPFLQIGGKWEEKKEVRSTSYAEMQLQVNLALLYGAKGVQLFPYCYPNEWLSSFADACGMVNRYGEPTEQFHYFSLAVKQLKAVQRDMMHARLTGVLSVGAYAGMLPEESVLQKILWNETIFRGNLPDCGAVEIQDYPAVRKAEATSQCLIGCFEGRESALLYAVNNSAVTAANLQLDFDRVYRAEVARKGKTESIDTPALSLKSLEAGEGVLIKLIKENG